MLVIRRDGGHGLREAFVKHGVADIFSVSWRDEPQSGVVRNPSSTHYLSHNNRGIHCMR